MSFKTVQHWEGITSARRKSHQSERSALEDLRDHALIAAARAYMEAGYEARRGLNPIRAFRMFGKARELFVGDAEHAQIRGAPDIYVGASLGFAAHAAYRQGKKRVAQNLGRSGIDRYISGIAVDSDPVDAQVRIKRAMDLSRAIGEEDRVPAALKFERRGRIGDSDVEGDPWRGVAMPILTVGDIPHIGEERRRPK